MALTESQLENLAARIKSWSSELGFAHTAIADTDLDEAEQRLAQWLDRGWHGEMSYMARHGTRRTRPAELVPGTRRVITVRMDYLPESMGSAGEVLADPARGYLSRYALGRDYHKVIRKKLQKLADRIALETGPFGYRVFCDSAPVMEKALAAKSGQGWLGKHTNVLNRDSGSWFFLGELYTDLPLPTDAPVTDHCGRCTACIDVCPTGAIVAPYQLDATRCISYHTIELDGPIPEEFRRAIGNRVYGCDDCQLVCPWNRFARLTCDDDFRPRHGLDNPALVELFAWTEAEFLQRTEGSAIRRIGYRRWLRNVAVALGNAPTSDAIVHALKRRLDDPSALVREHVEWALAQHESVPASTEHHHPSSETP